MFVKLKTRGRANNPKLWRDSLLLEIIRFNTTVIPKRHLCIPDLLHFKKQNSQHAGQKYFLQKILQNLIDLGEHFLKFVRKFSSSTGCEFK